MKRFLYAWLFMSGALLAQAQRSDGSLPYSFSHAMGNPIYPYVWSVARPVAEIEKLENSEIGRAHV